MIRLHHVSKTFDGGLSYAVKDLSFQVETGGTLVLIGSSGCSKTTEFVTDLFTMPARQMASLKDILNELRALYGKNSVSGLTMSYFSRKERRRIGAAGLDDRSILAYSKKESNFRFYETNPEDGYVNPLDFIRE